MNRFDLIAFDADDTLWHNERLYVEAQTQFKALLAEYHDPAWIDARLYEAEMRNLPHFGYGIKAFALSLIETALELTEGRISGRDIGAILDIAKRMLAADVELLDHAGETVARLSKTRTLMLITKGDLRDQERKIERSGLAPHFRHIEIVSDKSAGVYRGILARHGVPAERFLMVGNSLKSDVLPVLELGGHAVYIPHHLTWAHEVVEPPPGGTPGFHELEHLGRLPELLDRLDPAREPGALR